MCFGHVLPGNISDSLGKALVAEEKGESVTRGWVRERYPRGGSVSAQWGAWGPRRQGKPSCLSHDSHACPLQTCVWAVGQDVPTGLCPRDSGLSHGCPADH